MKKGKKGGKALTHISYSESHEMVAKMCRTRLCSTPFEYSSSCGALGLVFQGFDLFLPKAVRKSYESDYGKR
jgi:hypothetical protein